MKPWPGGKAAARALERGSGRGVSVAVLDSGIEISHPQFAGRSLLHDVVVETSTDGSLQPGEGHDCYGHGTAVAGLIWREAPEVHVGSFRVLDPHLSTRSVRIALAAREAIRLGYRIINCSFSSAIPGHVALYKAWLDEAFLAGVHVVAAASGGQTEWPAHFSSVLGIAAASGGVSLRRRRANLVEFQLGAENLEVPWLGGVTRRMTGSSFAAARLSGLLARLLSEIPDCDPLLAKSLLRHWAGEIFPDPSWSR
jgi:hypothetical protein